MILGLDIAAIGALVGDPARANMLHALMDGGALTAGELAYVAGVSPQTTSMHLAKLREFGLLELVKQGRRHYYHLASPQVGQMIESIMAVAAAGPKRNRRSLKIDSALRQARTCYDHLAGRLGVAIADSLASRELIALSADGGEVTETGVRFFAGIGVDLRRVQGKKRIFCRPCLDWSERRLHLAGAVGAALAERCFELGWIERIRDTRAVMITSEGRRGFEAAFDASFFCDRNPGCGQETEKERVSHDG